MGVKAARDIGRLRYVIRWPVPVAAGVPRNREAVIGGGKVIYFSVHAVGGWGGADGDGRRFGNQLPACRSRAVEGPGQVSVVLQLWSLVLGLSDQGRASLGIWSNLDQQPVKSHYRRGFRLG
jgi:hypothetical protein